MMLIDEFLKKYSYREFHEINVKANSELVYPSLLNTDFRNLFLVKILFRLRGLKVSGTIKDLNKFGFIKLGENNNEILFGLISHKWNFSYCENLSPEEFKKYSGSEYLKAVINFRTQNAGFNETIVSTETRVFCDGQQICKRFRAYWTFISPFSRYIRRSMLKEIKKKAERVPA